MTTDFRALCAELTDVLDGLFEDPEIPGEIRRSHSLEEYLTRARAALADEPASVVGEPSDEEIIAFWSDHCAGDGDAGIIRLARWGNPAPQPPADGTEEQVWPPSVADGCHEAAISAVTGSPEQQLLATAGNTIDNLWNELEREGWALHRLHRLQQENARFHEPERTILCDILANGTLLPDPDGKRYGVQPVDGEAAELVTWLKENAEYSDYQFEPEDAVMFRRAAELLERHAEPGPVPVNERLPGPKDCDAEGRCWWWYPEVPGKTYGYWAHEDDAVPERAFNEQPLHWLPAHALPLPGQEVDG